MDDVKGPAWAKLSTEDRRAGLDLDRDEMPSRVRIEVERSGPILLVSLFDREVNHSLQPDHQITFIAQARKKEEPLPTSSAKRLHDRAMEQDTAESLESQVNRLASYIMREFPDHPAWGFSEGACDKAMRILGDFKGDRVAVDRGGSAEQDGGMRTVINDPNGGRR